MYLPKNTVGNMWILVNFKEDGKVDWLYYLVRIIKIIDFW